MIDQRLSRFERAWKSMSFRFSIYYLCFLLFITLFSPIIATKQPLLVKDADGFHYPAFAEWWRGNEGLQQYKNWKNDNDAIIIMALIPYSPGESDLLNSDYKSPFDEQFTRNEDGSSAKLPLRYRHWLGTDLRGTDIFSGILHGAKISLTIGLITSILSSIIGLLLGGIAGWMSTSGWQVCKGKFVSSLLVAPFIFHILFTGNLPYDTFFLRFLLIGIVVIFGILSGKLLSRHNFFNKSIQLPIDTWITRLTEIFSTFPKILIILVFAGFMKPSWWNVIVLLTITGWSDMTRLTRAEILRINTFNYLDAARLSGASMIRILWKHVLPNAIPALSVLFVFSVALNILIESSMSFLGLGVPPGTVTWGTLLAEGKDQLSAWWLVLFPGLMLSLTIVALQRIAEGLQVKY